MKGLTRPCAALVESTDVDAGEHRQASIELALKLASFIQRLVRLSVEDTALSRRRDGFDSRTSYSRQDVSKRISCLAEVMKTNALCQCPRFKIYRSDWNSGCRGAAPRVPWEHEIVGSSPTIPTAAAPHCGFGDVTEGAFPLPCCRRHKSTKSARCCNGSMSS